MIETGPKFYMIPSPTQYMHDLKVEVTDLEFCFVLFFFTVSVFFAKPSMDLNHVWHDTVDPLYNNTLYNSKPLYNVS